MAAHREADGRARAKADGRIGPSLIPSVPARSRPVPAPRGSAPRRTGKTELRGVTALLLAALSLLFVLRPDLDIAASALFAGPDGAFPAADSPVLLVLRDVNRWLTILAFAAILALLLLGGQSARVRRLAPPHRLLFVLAAFVLGPGVIVQGLKEVIGRARPDQILAFGGDGLFTVPWQFSDACAGNCSFSSGEAASAAGLVLLLFLVPRARRLAAGLVLVSLAVLFSLNRLAMGRHFLSDVLVSWAIVALVAACLWPLFRDHARAIDGVVERLGTGVRRLVLRQPR